MAEPSTSEDPELGTPMRSAQRDIPYTPFMDARGFEPARGSSYADPVFVKHPLLSGPLTLIACCAAIYLLVFLQDVLVVITFAIFMM